MAVDLNSIPKSLEETQAFIEQVQTDLDGVEAALDKAFDSFNVDPVHRFGIKYPLSRRWLDDKEIAEIKAVEETLTPEIKALVSRLSDLAGFNVHGDSKPVDLIKELMQRDYIKNGLDQTASSQYYRMLLPAEISLEAANQVRETDVLFKATLINAACAALSEQIDNGTIEPKSSNFHFRTSVGIDTTVELDVLVDRNQTVVSEPTMVSSTLVAFNHGLNLSRIYANIELNEVVQNAFDYALKDKES